jgi:hypothetical protein
MRQMFTGRSSIAFACLAGLAALMAACGASPVIQQTGNGNPTGGSQPSGGGRSPNPGGTQQPCTLPVVTDQYEGFRIGVPSGWTLTRIGGSLVVAKDASDTTEADVVPALAASGLTASGFYTQVTSGIEKLVNGGSQSITFSQTGTANGGVQATVSGQLNGAPISGVATVTVQSLSTEHASQLLVFAGYWAPSSQLGGEQSTLAGIAACYQLTRGQLLRVFRDQQFTYALPPGWSPKEQFNILELNDGNDASANYFFLETLTPSQGVTDARSLLQYLLSHVGISGVTALSTASAPKSTTVTGAVQQTLYEEFTGRLSGAAVHGLASSTAVTGGGNTTGVVRLALTKADMWNALAGVVEQMAGGIQHSFVQDLGQIANVSRQWQNFDNQVAGFDDALNGVDIALDPSTGVPYEVPYGDWDPNGPGGPGYYLPGESSPLQVVTP